MACSYVSPFIFIILSTLCVVQCMLSSFCVSSLLVASETIHSQRQFPLNDHGNNNAYREYNNATKASASHLEYYHTTTELLRQVEETVKKGHGRCRNDRGSGKRVYRLRGDDNGESADGMIAVRVGIDGERHNNRIKVMVVANEHGRELISGEVLLRFVERMCGLHPFDRSDDVAEYLLVPVVNVWGRRTVENGNWCERLNPRYVDINRNYDYLWGRRDTRSLPEEERPGSRAFSEGESRRIRSLARWWKPDVYVSLHSGGRALVMPWDSGYGRVAEPVRRRLSSVLQTIRELYCGDCMIGTSRELFGYSAFGTGVDYMMAREYVPFAFTAEIYGNASQESNDCFTLFNPSTMNDYEEVVSHWSRAIVAIGYEFHAQKHKIKDHPAYSAAEVNTNDRQTLAEEEKDVAGSAISHVTRSAISTNGIVLRQSWCKIFFGFGMGFVLTLFLIREIVQFALKNHGEYGPLPLLKSSGLTSIKTA